MNGAATDPLRCTSRTLTSTTGALLAPRLLAAARDLATGLRSVGALTSSRKLGDDVNDTKYISTVRGMGFRFEV